MTVIDSYKEKFLESAFHPLTIDTQQCVNRIYTDILIVLEEHRTKGAKESCFMGAWTFKTLAFKVITQTSVMYEK